MISFWMHLWIYSVFLMTQLNLMTSCLFNFLFPTFSSPSSSLSYFWPAVCKFHFNSWWMWIQVLPTCIFLQVLWLDFYFKLISTTYMYTVFFLSTSLPNGFEKGLNRVFDNFQSLIYYNFEYFPLIWITAFRKVSVF